MAVLPDQSRWEIWAELMVYYSDPANALGETGIDKPDLRAFVNAVDQWVEDNTVSFNSALPEPARSTLSKQQKALGLSLVVARRYLEDA